ncbi:MAG: GNAT family N-acetyltransferase [Anaerolineae bacterium]|nr:GNAT family N-acetyltransferase [Anaerolineae bacterium]
MKLETERLILRDFVEDDWRAMLEYQSDPLYLRYYEWTEGKPEVVKQFIGWFLDHQKQQPRIKFQLAVVLKSNNQLIGNCGVRMNEADSQEADIGYELNPKHWNQGYATEAASAIVDFGFSHFGVHRIWADCIADNVGSAHVLEKLGMKLEGRLRENKHFKGKWWDTLIYAVLADEWDSHKQNNPVQWKELKD